MLARAGGRRAQRPPTRPLCPGSPAHIRATVRRVPGRKFSHNDAEKQAPQVALARVNQAGFRAHRQHREVRCRKAGCSAFVPCEECWMRTAEISSASATTICLEWRGTCSFISELALTLSATWYSGCFYAAIAMLAVVGLHAFRTTLGGRPLLRARPTLKLLPRNLHARQAVAKALAPLATI